MSEQLENIHIKPIESCHSRVATSYERHRIFELLWYKKTADNFCMKIDHEPVEMRDHSFFLLAKGQIHESKGDATGYSITIHPNFFQISPYQTLRILFNPFRNEAMNPKGMNLEQLQQNMNMIELEQNSTNCRRVQECYVAAILYKLAGERASSNINIERSQPLEKLFELVENHYLTERSNEFYAEKVGLSSKRVNQIVQKRIGLTLTQLLHKLVIAEAKRMIGDGNLTMKEIAYQLGFSEQAYFSRFFKKQFGMSPEQFKNSLNRD